MEENGFGLVCLLQNYGLAFIGFSLKLSDGTLSSDIPSRTDSPKADPEIEPPIMVINTVLSVMAYDYPTEKLSVYLSDDGGSEITFYALLEASNFAKNWIPFCKRYKIEPRSPAAYFNTIIDSTDTNLGNELAAIKETC
ncbi:hypothetical protein TSUD_128190 [Trifolium subterraneum]|nr:hypothetical protein TSUD_128190 [Trifolium subterraneum]